MSSPRLRRLASDYESVRAEFSGNPHVHVVPIGPNRPPEGYRVTYRVRGLRLDGSQPVAVDEHVVEIRLPLEYPHEKPVCIAVTPVFHPNIKKTVCIQDYWAAGQPLVDTIAKIGDMIQYRIYNPRSPLDAIAARWSQENSSLFPLGNVALNAPQVAISLGGKRSGPSSDSAGAASIESLAQIEAEPEPEEEFAISLRSSR